MKSIQKITITTILLIGSILYSCSSSTLVETDVQNKKPLLIYAKGDVYKPEWRKVDSLEQNGLTKSALTEVASIYKKAVEEENHEQLLKSLIVKAKFQSYIEEDAFVKTVQELTIEATQSEYPLDPLLHSVIAEMYWQYYQRNRWKFHGRSATIGFDNNDILTWDLKKIIEVVTKQYLLSIENIESLKRTPVETFSEIIIEDSASHYRPFLYDFLAHRAADFFMNGESNLTATVNEFVMDSAEYLGSAGQFASVELITKDSTSLKYFALNILQKLTINHITTAPM